VRGLPPHVVAANVCCAVAAWRGAFLAHGSLTEPGRSCAMEITCPGPEAALALVGAARRIGLTAKAREVRGVDRVVVKDGDAIGALLTRIGAHNTVLKWEERRVPARSARRPTGSRTSTTRTCGGPRGPRSPRPRASHGRWKFSRTRHRST
jgi:DNA-binding protein WhiA